MHRYFIVSIMQWLAMTWLPQLPHTARRNGRGAFLAIKGQHAGRHIYDKIVKDATYVLTVRKWTGAASITLAQHLAAHRKSYIALMEASIHTPTEIPNPRQRVTYVLSSFDTVDPKVLAAMAAVELDATNMRTDFEQMAAYMLPHCPVAAKSGKKIALGAKISGAGAILTGKKGKSGVTLCYHEPRLFHKLLKDQKAELSEWTKNNRENGGGKRKNGGTPGQEKGWRVKARANEQIAAMNASHTADLAVMKAQLDLMGVSNASPADAVIKPSVGATVGFVPAPALLLPGLVETLALLR